MSADVYSRSWSRIFAKTYFAVLAMLLKNISRRVIKQEVEDNSGQGLLTLLSLSLLSLLLLLLQLQYSRNRFLKRNPQDGAFRLFPKYRLKSPDFGKESCSERCWAMSVASSLGKISTFSLNHIIFTHKSDDIAENTNKLASKFQIKSDATRKDATVAI